MSKQNKVVSYFYDEDCANYCLGGGSVMRPHRVRMTNSLIQEYGLNKNMKVLRPQYRTEEDLEQFHADDYVQFLKNVTTDNQDLYAKQMRRFNLGPSGEADCPVFDGMFEYCLSYTGGSVDAANLILRKDADICLNWAGGMHHAKKGEASGFCYVNDIVLAILELLKQHHRVLYVDIDIHHGDGVEEAFYLTDRVMTVSFHKYGDYFPGTGALEDKGYQTGKNYALNAPLKQGMNDEAYKFVYEPVMQQVMEKYQPDCIVICGGADSLAGDRLGCFNLSLEGHSNCMEFLAKFNVPMLVLGGGGYTLRNVARCWTYETGRLNGIYLPNDIPLSAQKEHYFYLDNDQLRIQVSNMRNANSTQDLEDIRLNLLQQIQQLPPPSGAQLTVAPPLMGSKASLETPEENPEIRGGGQEFEDNKIYKDQYYSSNEKAARHNRKWQPDQTLASQAYQPSFIDQNTNINSNNPGMGVQVKSEAQHQGPGDQETQKGNHKSDNNTAINTNYNSNSILNNNASKKDRDVATTYPQAQQKLKMQKIMIDGSQDLQMNFQQMHPGNQNTQNTQGQKINRPLGDGGKYEFQALGSQVGEKKTEGSKKGISQKEKQNAQTNQKFNNQINNTYLNSVVNKYTKGDEKNLEAQPNQIQQQQLIKQQAQKDSGAVQGIPGSQSTQDRNHEVMHNQQQHQSNVNMGGAKVYTSQAPQQFKNNIDGTHAKADMSNLKIQNAGQDYQQTNNAKTTSIQSIQVHNVKPLQGLSKSALNDLPTRQDKNESDNHQNRIDDILSQDIQLNVQQQMQNMITSGNLQQIIQQIDPSQLLNDPNINKQHGLNIVQQYIQQQQQQQQQQQKQQQQQLQQALDMDQSKFLDTQFRQPQNFEAPRLQHQNLLSSQQMQDIIRSLKQRNTMNQDNSKQ